AVPAARTLWRASELEEEEVDDDDAERAETAWSNTSLVGCRVSVLLENREWSEGLVTQYHRSSGKHCVEFRHSGARRWLVMLRTAFYIVDRCNSALSEETKEPDGSLNSKGLPEPWTFSEDLSLAYAKAQSTMHECYGRRVQETGHKTLGHTCVTEEDKRAACEIHGSLLYGELLPRGVNKALDERHLDARRATSLFDLGMGTGKVAMQAFLQFPNLRRVYGVELSSARFKVAEEALLILASSATSSHEPNVRVQSHVKGESLTVVKTTTKQTLEIAHGNLFATRDLDHADVVMLETEIPSNAFPQFSTLLDSAREGCRVLTYLDLRKVWQLPGRPFPFRQLESNRSFADRYPTSWSVHRGHHLFLWVKVLKPSSHASYYYGHPSLAVQAAAGKCLGTLISSPASHQQVSPADSPATQRGGGGGATASVATCTKPGPPNRAPTPTAGTKTPTKTKRGLPQSAAAAAAAAAKDWGAEDVACNPKWPALVSRSASKKAAQKSSCIIS
ncbi:hypothetical protein CTAYLR_000465, partial [Chrysophaeum taylorii]